MKWYDDFIGNDFSSINMPFIGGDHEHDFQKNSKTQPKDWYYHSVPISYQFNSLGHRSKEIADIDLDNYILYTGCSHTTGVGIELEKTFPYLISQKLGCDYYNLGLPATGIDVVEYNLLTWFAKVRKKPKVVCIQWPDHSRYLSLNPEYQTMVESGTWDSAKDSVSLIVNSEDSGLFYARKKLAMNIINTVIDCPIITCNFGGQSQYDIENFSMRKIDLARDLSHAGIKSNEDFANKLYDKIKLLNTQ